MKVSEKCEKLFSSRRNFGCEKGHVLLWTENTDGEYKDGKYRCRLCLNNFLCSAKRWWCKECKYDVCPHCKPFQRIPVPGECDNGHKLSWSTKDYFGGNRYMCNFCGIALPGKSGRWWCSKCNYDICPLCTGALRCDKDHAVIWLSDGPPAFYESKKGACDLCGKIEDYTNNFWHCEECDYDICSECTKIKAKLNKKRWIKNQREMEEIFDIEAYIQQMEEKNEDIDPLCQICMNSQANHALVPCGHLLCEVCCESFTECPFDRVKYKKKVPLIF